MTFLTKLNETAKTIGTKNTAAVSMRKLSSRMRNRRANASAVMGKAACPYCGSVNSLAKKFCGTCGQRLGD